MKSQIFIIGFLASVASGASVSAAPRVVGGEAVSIKDAPWHVAVLKAKTNEFLCAGTIVNDNRILTAAHCVANGDDEAVDPSTIVIRSGSDSWQSGGQLSPVKAIKLAFMYDHYDLDNDFALVNLTEPLKLSDVRQAVPIRKSAPVVNEAAQIVGWGDWVKPTKTLRRINTKVVDTATCKYLYNQMSHYLGDASFCAGETDVANVATCVADVGGGLIAANGEVIGVSSWSGGCSQPGVTLLDVYALIDPMSWS